MFIGIASQLDNSVASLSIQPYYQLLVSSTASGTEGANLYGLANGIYWLAQFAFAPIFGNIIDRLHTYKLVFIVGMGLQAAGNVLYAMCFFIQTHYQDGKSNIGWQLLIVSRAIQGMGSAVVVSGTTYITSNTTMKDRMSILGSYRTSQLLAASVGGAFAYLFIAIPEPTPESSAALEILNFYTMGGWVSVILCLSVMTMCLVRFTEIPPLIVLTKSIFEYVKECEVRMKQSVWLFVVTCCSVQFIFFFSMLSIQTQVFNLSFSAFKVVDSQQGIWKPWIALALGALPASYFWKVLSPKFGPKPEKVWTNIGIACGLATTVCLLPYWGNDGGKVGPAALMYIAFALLGMAQVWFGVNQEIVYSKQISYMTHVDEVSANYDGSFISFYLMTNALANFFGPFVVGFVWISTQFPGSTYPCGVAAGAYNNAGCYVTNYGAWIGVLLIALSVSLLVNGRLDAALVTYPAAAATTEGDNAIELTDLPMADITTSNATPSNRIV